MSTHTHLNPQRKHTRLTAQFLSAKYNELAGVYPSFSAQVSRKRYVSIHLKGTVQ